jgi:hypothetical protein
LFSHRSLMNGSFEVTSKKKDRSHQATPPPAHTIASITKPCVRVPSSCLRKIGPVEGGHRAGNTCASCLHLHSLNAYV